GARQSMIRVFEGPSVPFDSVRDLAAVFCLFWAAQVNLEGAVIESQTPGSGFATGFTCSGDSVPFGLAAAACDRLESSFHALFQRVERWVSQRS
ncbi:MAG: hypothetical protein ABSD13_20145, partial [Candidatus Korobacteraceae bacterium]